MIVSGEGSKPIFDRPEIYKSRRDYEEDSLGSSRPDRLNYGPSTSYNDNVRIRDSYSDKDRERNLSSSRHSPRDYEPKPREDRLREDFRYQTSASSGRSRSFDRSRDYQTERKSRYDDRDLHSRGAKRSLDRGRSDERILRRRPSPLSKRLVEGYREGEEKRARSLERRDETSYFRDRHDYPDDRFSNSEHSAKSRNYSEVEGRENPSPSRGRGSGFYGRGRGGTLSGRPFNRNTGFAPMHYAPISITRPIRVAPLARVPGMRIRPHYAPRKSFRGSLQGRR